MAELFSIPFSPPRCPRCSSKAVQEDEFHMTFLCGTELVFDERDNAWEHDWSEDANIVCRHIEDLQQQLGQLEALVPVVEQAREALAFSAVTIRSGEPWTATCERVIGGALAACKPTG